MLPTIFLSLRFRDVFRLLPCSSCRFVSPKKLRIQSAYNLICSAVLGVSRCHETTGNTENHKKKTKETENNTTIRHDWESLNGGLANGGLRYLPTIVHDCTTIVVVWRRKFPLERGPKGPLKCTIVDDCAQIAESGLKPPFVSPI